MKQISMFDFMNSLESTNEIQPSYTDDPKINQLIDLISAEMDKILPQFPRLKRKKVEYSIWDHVKNLGLRLWYDYWFDCECRCEPNKWCGVGVKRIAELIPVNKLKKEASSLGLKLDIMQSPNTLSFTTIEKRYTSKSKEIEEEI